MGSWPELYPDIFSKLLAARLVSEVVRHNPVPCTSLVSTLAFSPLDCFHIPCFFPYPVLKQCSLYLPPDHAGAICSRNSAVYFARFHRLIIPAEQIETESQKQVSPYFYIGRKTQDLRVFDLIFCCAGGFKLDICPIWVIQSEFK